MLRRDVNNVFFVVFIVLFNFYTVVCIPTLRRGELENVRDVVHALYIQRHINSFKLKRNPTIGPDLGYGNRWHAGYRVAHLQTQIHKLTGSHSPGKRSLGMLDVRLIQ